MGTRTPNNAEQAFKAWEAAMTRIWDDALDDPVVVGAMGDQLGAYAQMRGAFEGSVDRTMAAMHLPSHADVTRLAKIASLLEDRLLGLEDRLLEQGDRLVAAEKETLKARIDAAEAVLEVRDRLGAIDAKLDRIEQALGRKGRRGGGMIAIPSALGNRGASPHEVVARVGKAAVRFFRPRGEARQPLFVVMPMINTWTIWDLLPGRSVVQALATAGHPVYVLDWGRAGPEDADCPLAHYVDDVLGACRSRTARHAGTQALGAIGYCVGGTFLATHLARHGGAAKAALVAAPIDFHASGRLSTWARHERFPLDKAMDSLGRFPGSLMQLSFAVLAPMGQWRKWVNHAQRRDDPAYAELFAAMESWNGDGVDFPGEAYREYVRACYLENRLITGGWNLAGVDVDLGRATMPLLAISADEDHIAPPAACDAVVGRWGGPATAETLRGGHVGISIGAALPAALVRWFA